MAVQVDFLAFLLLAGSRGIRESLGSVVNRGSPEVPRADFRDIAGSRATADSRGKAGIQGLVVVPRSLGIAGFQDTPENLGSADSVVRADSRDTRGFLVLRLRLQVTLDSAVYPGTLGSVVNLGSAVFVEPQDQLEQREPADFLGTAGHRDILGLAPSLVTRDSAERIQVLPVTQGFVGCPDIQGLVVLDQEAH